MPLTMFMLGAAVMRPQTLISSVLTALPMVLSLVLPFMGSVAYRLFQSSLIVFLSVGPRMPFLLSESPHPKRWNLGHHLLEGVAPLGAAPGQLPLVLLLLLRASLLPFAAVYPSHSEKRALFSDFLSMDLGLIKL